jgi:hypothetical protein
MHQRCPVRSSSIAFQVGRLVFEEVMLKTLQAEIRLGSH